MLNINAHAKYEIIKTEIIRTFLTGYFVSHRHAHLYVYYVKINYMYMIQFWRIIIRIYMYTHTHTLTYLPTHSFTYSLT